MYTCKLLSLIMRTGEYAVTKTLSLPLPFRASHSPSIHHCPCINTLLQCIPANPSWNSFFSFGFSPPVHFPSSEYKGSSLYSGNSSTNIPQKISPARQREWQGASSPGGGRDQQRVPGESSQSLVSTHVFTFFLAILGKPRHLLSY